MWGLPTIDTWHLDAFASFIVLVGEHQELRYRRSQHRWSSLWFFPAPVAGLQSYLHSNSKIIDHIGWDYISPYSSKRSILRNLRIEAVIAHNNLLRDGDYYRYKIPHSPKQWPGLTWLFWSLWLILCWGTCGVFFWGMIHCPDTTWIGTSLCFSLGVWSLILRILDLYCIRPSDPSDADISEGYSPDAAIFFGRRNSGLVLEGFRRDVSLWTGRGLEERGDPITLSILTGIRRFGTLAMLLFIFATIPNGTIADQVGFIIFNGIGQLNLIACNSLSMARYLNSLDLEEKFEKVRTRTHIWALVIRYFYETTKGTEWVKNVQLIPDTPDWDLWKVKIIEDVDRDAKDIYNSCLGEIRLDKLKEHATTAVGNTSHGSS